MQSNYQRKPGKGVNQDDENTSETTMSDARGYYTHSINSDLSFTIFEKGIEVYRSRPFRLYSQAETKANEYIGRMTGKQADGITLNVQNMLIDADMLFGRLNRR